MEGVRNKFYILKALFYSLLFTLTMFFIWAIFITYGSIKVGTIPNMVNVITAVGVFLCAFMCAHSKRNKGFLIGITGAFLYMLVIILIGIFFYKNMGFTTALIWKVVFGFIIGAIAGIIGINTGFKKEKGRKRR